MRNHWARHVAFQRACRRYASMATPSIRPRATPARSLQWKSLTTLFYSTVMATACAADAHSKQQRRKLWDQRITELEEKLGIERPTTVEAAAAEDKQQTRGSCKILDAHMQTHIDVLPRTFNHDGNGATANQPIRDGRGSKRPLKLNARTGTDAEQQEQYRMPLPKFESADVGKLFRPLARGLTTVYMTTDYKPRSLSVAPGSILADRVYEPCESRPRARNWTWKKLINVETAVAQMTTRMMLRAATLSPDAVDPRSETAHHIRHYKENLRILYKRLQVIKSLKNADDSECIERMQYPQYKRPPRAARAWAGDLNKSIQDLLSKHSRNILSDEQVVSRIVYNLMISKQIPDNHTFTSLISYFTSIGQHDLAGILVRGLDASNIREDEMTVNAVLTHYIRSRNRSGFLMYAERMRGLHGGLYLAGPNTTIGPGSNVRMSKKHGKVQCIEEDRPIFTSLINGYLTFGKFASAIQAYKKMVEKGFEPDSRVFSSFLHFFSRMASSRKAQALDRKEVWSKGLATWHALKAARGQGGSSTEDFYMKAAYDKMLALCQSCDRSAEHDELLKERSAEELNGNQRPWFDKAMRMSRSQQRKLREMENVLVRIEDDLRKATARVVALKLLQAGESMSKIQEAFEQASRGITLKAWWKEPRSHAMDLRTSIVESPGDVAAIRASTAGLTDTDASNIEKPEVKPVKHDVDDQGSRQRRSQGVAWRPHAIPPHLTAQQWSTADLSVAAA